MSGNTLKARTLRGTALTLVHFGGAQLLRLLSNLLLTRILFPEAFGLMALVQVVILGLGMLSVTGVKTAIIQNKRGDDQQFLNTAWMVQIGRGLFLWVMVILMAGPAARFYDQPMLSMLLPVAGLAAVMNGLQSTKMSTANRHLNLGKLTFIELFSQIVSIIAMIAVALWTQSVWALVVGAVLADTIKVPLSHLLLPGPRNRPAWDPDAFWQIFHFGKYIFIGSIAGFLINTGDRAVLGKFVTLTELAVYNIAYFLATVPLMMSHQLGSRVLFPLYARATEDATSDTGSETLKARLWLTGGMLAASLFLGLIGDWLVQFLYEAEYHFAGPILVLIALAYLPTIAVNAYGHRLLALGNSRDMTVFTIVQAGLHIGILLVGIQALGLIGAIIAPPLAVLLVYPLIVFYMRRANCWEPKLDGMFLACCAIGAGLVLWVNDTAITLVLRGIAG